MHRSLIARRPLFSAILLAIIPIRRASWRARSKQQGCLLLRVLVCENQEILSQFYIFLYYKIIIISYIHQQQFLSINARFTMAQQYQHITAECVCVSPVVKPLRRARGARRCAQASFCCYLFYLCLPLHWGESNTLQWTLYNTIEL